MVYVIFSKPLEILTFVVCFKQPEHLFKNMHIRVILNTPIERSGHEKTLMLEY